jgi:hypothetical protein
MTALAFCGNGPLPSDKLLEWHVLAASRGAIRTAPEVYR